MIILSWNIKGYNLPGKQKFAKNWIKKHKVDIIILQETKLKGGK